jgi:EpsI family protein
LIQAGLFWGCSRSELVPPRTNLRQIARTHGGWQMTYETEIDKDQQEILKADDTVYRFYQRPDSPIRASLFIASFLSQRSGRAPHSPKNCLPGAGWAPTESEFRKVPVDNRAEPIEVNRYIIEKGESKQVVYYWYQSRDRAVASEYWAKFFVAFDAMKLNRTDSALVRVIADVPGGDTAQAEAAVLDFIKRAYPEIRKQLPA